MAEIWRLSDAERVEYRERAEARVRRSARMRQYWDVIFNDWDNMDEHLVWICEAPVAEIVAWAREIEIRE